MTKCVDLFDSHAVGLHHVDGSVNAHWDDHQRREAESVYLRNLFAKNGGELKLLSSTAKSTQECLILGGEVYAVYFLSS